MFNTNNNCSSASSALMLARLLVLSGQYNCVLALGKRCVVYGRNEKLMIRSLQDFPRVCPSQNSKIQHFIHSLD